MLLASATRSGCTPTAPGCPTPTGSDAGLDLVEDQHRAVLASDLAHGLQVAGLRQADADVLHDRFDDEARHVATGECLLEQLGTVVRDDLGIGQHGAGDACRGRDGTGLVGRAGLADRRLHRDHHLVVVAVIATFDLDDLVAAGDTAGDANGVHRRLGAAVGEPPHRQLVASGKHLGDVGVQLARRHEERAVVELALDRAAHDRVAVAGEQRAEAHVEVDVAIAVDVFHPRRLGATDHDRMRIVGLEARWHAHRHDLAGPLGGLHRTGGALDVFAEFALGDLSGSAGKFTGVDGFHCSHSILLADFVLASLAHHGIHRERPSARRSSGSPAACR